MPSRADAWGGPDKPLYGTPCNGCGLCCIAEQCPISLMVFFEQERCPALTLQGNVMVCGLLTDTWRYFHPTDSERVNSALPNVIGHLLGAGRGCDAQLEDEVKPEGADERMREGLDNDDMGRMAMHLLVACIEWVRLEWRI